MAKVKRRRGRRRPWYRRPVQDRSVRRALRDGQKQMFEDGNVFEAEVRVKDNTAFWELRPDWLVR